MTKSSNDGGYGKPPKHAQFQPGKSGNPKGRPKGSKSFAALIQKELASETTINVGGEPHKTTTRHVVVKQLVRGAASGKRAALDAVVRLDDEWQAKQGRLAKERELVPPERWLDKEIPMRLPLQILENYADAIQAMMILQKDMYQNKVKFYASGCPRVITEAVNLAFNEAVFAYEASEESKQPGAWHFPWEKLAKANAKITRDATRRALRAKKGEPLEGDLGGSVSG